MAIKVQKFVIDDAVLDLIGNEFKFDHTKGLAEWLKNSVDAYLREQIPDEDQHILIRLHEDGGGALKTIECIDFVGMTKQHIDDAFKRFFDPQAAKKGAKLDRLKTLGGHGNGGKFYMRQMFKESAAITYRGGKMNIFGFNAQKKYGFDSEYDDRAMSPEEALRVAGIDTISIPPAVKSRILRSRTGFTVVRGQKPAKARGTARLEKLIEELRLHPQARRLIERKKVMVLVNSDTEPSRLTCPTLQAKEGFEAPVTVEVPALIQYEDREVAFTSKQYTWAGRLILKTSAEPLRGTLSPLNTVDFIGEIGVIASYKIHELGATRFSGQSEFLYGECECPILEDPDHDCVRNDRQKLIETDRSLALLQWVRDQVESLAERMEISNSEDKKKQDLKNTSIFNEMLNRWKNRFMNKIWSEVFVGDGPAGVSGFDSPDGPPASNGGGTGGNGDSNTSNPDSAGGQTGGDEKKKKPRFPRVLISGQDTDPLDPLSTQPFYCDKRHPAVYQRTKDVSEGIYWINTSRPLAEKIIQTYTSDSARWRDYLFQRYVDIIIKEAIYQLVKIETSPSADDVNRCIDDITTRIHDEAAKDLNSFLFDEDFGAN